MSIYVSTASLEELGWRQCSIVVGRDLPGLREVVNNYQDNDIFIVLPYSCAVVQMDFQKEPNVELFRVRKVEKKDKGLQFGRNPRELQIVVQNGNETFLVNGSIHDRFFIEHSLFTDKSPDTNLSLNETECVIVKNWFAKRYIRNAFPTEFNKRIRTATSSLRNGLKRNSSLDELLGIYLILDPSDEEIPNIEEPYDIEVFFLVKESAIQNKDIIKIKDQFEKDLKECDGVMLSQIKLRSETDILLSEYRDLIRLDDYDYISHKDDHDDPIIT